MFTHNTNKLKTKPQHPQKTSFRKNTTTRQNPHPQRKQKTMMVQLLYHDGTESVLLSGKKIDCRRGVLYSIAIWLRQSVWKK